LELADLPGQTGFFKESGLVRFDEKSLVEESKLGHNGARRWARQWPVCKPDQTGFFEESGLVREALLSRLDTT
jgi:hypothetical protein